MATGDRDATEAIAGRLAEVEARIAAACRSAGRDPGEVTLVAVGKTFPATAIEAALAAGQRVFGENRVQEAAAKFPDLRTRWPDLELHLIGPLQTNKARDAVRLADVIQSLDRPKLVGALAAAMDKEGRRPRCLVQVNTGEEAQKAGIAPDGLAALLAEARAAGIEVAGLMCIPPLEEPPALHFGLLAELARDQGLPLLSMGMSGDYETAVALGATHVRVGSAIFGARPPLRSGPG